MGKTIEKRAHKTEMRILTGEDGPVLEWYPIVYNSLSEELWGFREMVLPGSLTKTLQEADVRALFNHDPNYVMGRSSAGTLELNDTERGLQARVKLPEASWAKDLAVSVQRGDIDQGSFAFRMIREMWDKFEDQPLRKLAELELVDVSVVTYPAYPETAGAAVRSRLMEAGIDPVQMYEVMSRESLSPEEKELAAKAARVFEDLAAAPGQVPHPADDGSIAGEASTLTPDPSPLQGEGGEALARRLAVRRKCLDLLSKK